LRLAPSDWEAVGKVASVDVAVADFAMDRYEVTVAQWAACSVCPRRDVAALHDAPQTQITPAEAQHYCETVGGRLPTSNEWRFAASSSLGYRYPWGHTGLVCRKAVYGMVRGPCGDGASSPNAVGSRDMGVTP